MGLLRFNYRSLAIGKYIDISIAYPTDMLSFVENEETLNRIAFKPQPGDKFPYRPNMKFQTVYLIHGGGDDDSLTYRYTNAERYAQEHCVMLVTPDISNTFGVNARYGISWQTFLSEELPKVVQGLFASSPKREDNFIMGYAMGANVALGTAVMHPELYHTCVDISGGIGMTLDTAKLKSELEGDHFRYRMPLFNASFGPAEELEGSEFDLYNTAKKFKEEGRELSKFKIICGSKEFIRRRVEGDVAKLQELEYDLEYIVAEGFDHNFDMWDTYIKYSLDNLLPLRNAPIYENE